jgi:hypothetical protein
MTKKMLRRAVNGGGILASARDLILVQEVEFLARALEAAKLLDQPESWNVQERCELRLRELKADK